MPAVSQSMWHGVLEVALMVEHDDKFNEVVDINEHAFHVCLYFAQSITDPEELGIAKKWLEHLFREGYIDRVVYWSIRRECGWLEQLAIFDDFVLNQLVKASSNFA